MSVDINWDTLTGGPDGQALAETVKEFIHERFQQIDLPKLIRSVKVHSFDFGTVPPAVVLKDICEPLSDFYETDDEEADSPGVVAHGTEGAGNPAARSVKSRTDVTRPGHVDLMERATSPTLTRGAMLGGGPGLGYFHPAFATGLAGTNTPLAAVAGAQFQQGTSYPESHRHHHSGSFDSSSPPPTATPPSRPGSREHSYFDSHRASAILDGQGDVPDRAEPGIHERSPEDLQVVFHATYSGDIKLSMTAEVVLDYPMPSFVGIPLKLKITGMKFDGVGILAYIKKRAHLCFLNPDDAEALVGSEDAYVAPDDDAHTTATGLPQKVGGLLEEIHIESEMGETEEGKQVLKNVGKIEKFILEQVQRIFEEEFVYPSYWTFLV